MVLKQAPDASKLPPYPITPSDPQTNTNQTQHATYPFQVVEGAHNDLANLSLQEDGEVEESSDWDASDREDNDTNKNIDDRPPVGRRTAHHDNISQPHLPENQIPEPLRLKKPTTSKLDFKASALSQNTSFNDQTISSTVQAAPKQNTNPFRRPSDFTSNEPSKGATLGENASNVPKAMLESSHSGRDEKLDNPWADESNSPFLASGPAHATRPMQNPWAEEDSSTEPQQRAHDQYLTAPTDHSYMADLIDLGSGDNTGQVGTEDNTRSSPRQKDTHTGAQPSETTITVKDSKQAQGDGNATTTPKQRNEFYQIKHIRWHDPNSKKNPRHSPILTQNANGPCPLLALVNALSLSTPPGTETALIETLRTRETVSLGLLLDAVFEELMSGRRGATASQLPDVGELYSFLVTLHTGMNVNPRFVPDAHQAIFEQTKEMLLYSTFNIPLVHGWTPSATDPAYSAFRCTAATYEDAQHVRFQEEELEQKLGQAELSSGEEQVLRDLPLIKQFFAMWPTQLTEHGLHFLSESTKPGQIVILFRNDHFATVFKEPKSGQLMTLVTDTGYSSHEEIVWESLVDINGAQSEMFSGDFRSVTHNNQRASSGQSSDRRLAQRQAMPQQTTDAPSATTSSGFSAPSGNPPTEQEDADLALALRLQEEEEHEQREEEAARRRQERLSQSYLDNESARRGPQIPPRGRRNPSQTTARPLDGDELPSYEQAASERRYNPPPGNPGLGRRSTGITSGQLPEQRQGMGRVPGQAVWNGRRRGRSGATPFDGGAGTSCAKAVADRREGCKMM